MFADRVAVVAELQFPFDARRYPCHRNAPSPMFHVLRSMRRTCRNRIEIQMRTIKATIAIGIAIDPISRDVAISLASWSGLTFSAVANVLNERIIPITVNIIPHRRASRIVHPAAELVTSVLRWFAVAQFFSALSVGMQGALMGAGDTTPALRYTVWGQWVVMIPLAYMLMFTVGWDPEGALAAWTIAPVITLVLTWRRLRTGRWKAIRTIP